MKLQKNKKIKNKKQNWSCKNYIVKVTGSHLYEFHPSSITIMKKCAFQLEVDRARGGWAKMMFFNSVRFVNVGVILAQTLTTVTHQLL